MAGTLARIKKRDGEIADFVQEKITNAIYKAMASKGITDQRAAQSVSDIVQFVLEEKFGGYTMPSVEQIQDIVERVLMKQGYHDVAKAYILYRERHKDIREAKKIGLNLERLINDYINEVDWRIRENSNEGVMSFSGLNARVSGQVLANFALNQIYSEDVKNAHVAGDLHIHDLSYPIVGYCAGWSLENLLRKGFGHVPNQTHSFPARHLETATLHMVNQNIARIPDVLGGGTTRHTNIVCIISMIVVIIESKDGVLCTGYFPVRLTYPDPGFFVTIVPLLNLYIKLGFTIISSDCYFLGITSQFVKYFGYIIPILPAGGTQMNQQWKVGQVRVYLIAINNYRNTITPSFKPSAYPAIAECFFP